VVWVKVVRRAAVVGLAGCLLTATGSLGASAVPIVTASSRAAVSHLSLQFYELDGKTKVVTSRHDHRTLSVDVRYSPQGESLDARPRATVHSSADLTVALATTGNTESNQWDFSLPGSAFSASPAKGTGRLATGLKITPYGAIHLTLKPVGKLQTQNICAEERETSRMVKVSGHVLFNTGPGAAHSLGKVGRRRPLRFRADITARYDKPNDDPKCEASPDQPCPSAVTAEFDGPEQSDGSFTGFTAYPHGRSDALTGFRNVALSKPHGAQRVDEVLTRAHTMAITPQQQGTSVTVTADGPRAAGSATLNATGGPVSSTPDYCKHPSSETFYNATLAPQPSLRFHNKLGGTFAVPDALSAGVYFTYQRS
jgi:hypothetical protein